MALDQYYTDPSLEVARSNAETAAGTAAQYQGAASLFPYKLREAIQGKLDYNKDLIEQKNKAMENAFAAPSESRLQYQNIFNPFQREALVSRSVAQAYTPVNNLSDILSSRMGSINDIVGAGTAGFNADVQAKQSAAELARQAYTDKFATAKELTNLAMDQEKLNRSLSGSDLGELERFFKLFEPKTPTPDSGFPDYFVPDSVNPEGSALEPTNQPAESPYSYTTPKESDTRLFNKIFGY